MEKIQDFLETKKKYEAKLWDDQIGFLINSNLFRHTNIEFTEGICCLRNNRNLPADIRLYTR